MFFLQKERIFPGVHKIGAPISGPRIADTNFTDTKRIFLNKKNKLHKKKKKKPGEELVCKNFGVNGIFGAYFWLILGVGVAEIVVRRNGQKSRFLWPQEKIRWSQDKATPWKRAQENF